MLQTADMKHVHCCILAIGFKNDMQECTKLMHCIVNGEFPNYSKTYSMQASCTWWFVCFLTVHAPAVALYVPCNNTQVIIL